MITKSITIGNTTSNRPYGILTVTETSTSTPNNTSTVSISLVLKRPQNIISSATKSASCTINGTVYNWSGTIGGSGDKTLISTTQNIPHNSDGTKTISISASIQLDITWGGVQLGTITGSGSMVLTNIPRYASVTQSVVSKTENTITMKWSSNATVDYIWYSTNNGSTWHGIDVADGTSGTYVINGLYANSTYYVKTRIRRKDSQLTTDSAVMNVTTYAFPYANSTPNFTIGDKLTIGLFNPLARTVTVALLNANDNVISSVTTSGVTVSGFDTSDAQNALYTSIPNAQTGTYKIRVTYGSNSTTTNGGTFKVNPSVCSPTIAQASYADTAASVIAITGNNQDIVQNHSIVRYSASGLTAYKGATLLTCSVAVNGSTIPLGIIGSNATGGNATISSGQNVDAVFTVTDSRGLTGTKTISINILSWFIPSAIITLQRHNNFYSETDLNVDANFASINGNNQITITYAATKDGDSSASVSGTVQDNVTSVVTLDNNYAWTVVITLTDSFGGTSSYTTYISRGMPIIYFDRIKSSVGVNCFPANDKSFEIDGDLYINENPVADFIIEQGTSGDWTYRKYASGRVELDANITVDSANITWNTYLSTGLVYGNYRENYPFAITDAIITATLNYAGGSVGWISTAYDDTENSRCSVTMVRNGQTGNMIFSIHVLATVAPNE